MNTSIATIESNPSTANFSKELQALKEHLLKVIQSPGYAQLIKGDYLLSVDLTLIDALEAVRNAIEYQAESEIDPTKSPNLKAENHLADNFITATTLVEQVSPPLSRRIFSQLSHDGIGILAILRPIQQACRNLKALTIRCLRQATVTYVHIFFCK